MTTTRTRSRTYGRTRTNRPLIVAASLIGVVAVLFAIAFAAAYDPVTDDAATASAPSVTGQSLAPFAGGEQAGGVAPRASGPAVDGTGEVSLPVAGEPTILLFVAHWCPVCQREVPVVASWLEDGGLPSGVAFRAIATGNDPNRPNFPPATWLAGEGWTVPTLLDDGRVGEAYGLTAFPYWVFVNADGEVEGRMTGELSAEQLSSIAASLRE